MGKQLPEMRRDGRISLQRLDEVQSARIYLQMTMGASSRNERDGLVSSTAMRKRYNCLLFREAMIMHEAEQTLIFDTQQDFCAF